MYLMVQHIGAHGATLRRAAALVRAALGAPGGGAAESLGARPGAAPGDAPDRF